MREEDLQKALRSESADVAEAARPRPAEAIRARGDQRRRRQTIGTALLALAVLAGGGAAYAGYRTAQPAPQSPITHPVNPAPTPGQGSHTASPPAQQHTGAAKQLPAGRTGPRSAIPWTQIGPSWTLAEDSAGRPNRYGQWLGGGRMSLYLMDPKGGRYLVDQQADSQPPWTLLAWSGDGHTALFGVNTAAELPYGQYREVSLVTGAVTDLTLPAGVAPAGFSNPDGANLVAVLQSGTRWELQRYSLTGVLQATLASRPVPTGRVGDQVCPIYCGTYSSPDGSSVVWTYGDRLVLVGNQGGVLRELPVRVGGATLDCGAISWWNARTIVATCDVAGQAQLWLVPADGSTPTALTPASTAASDSARSAGAWQVAGQRYVNEATSTSCPEAGAGPAGSGIFRVGPDGTTPIAVRGSAGQYNTAIGSYGYSLLVLARTSCPGTTALLWLNPVTGVTTPLLTPAAGQAGVVAAFPFGRG